MRESTETGTYDENRPLPYRAISSSVGTDSSQSGVGNPRITIDMGKGVNTVAVCAALCGLATAISIWAAYTARDAQTEARMMEYYLMDPHSRTPDEMAAWVKFQKEHEKR